MNQSQYLAALQKLGLSQVGAAPVLGISRRTAQRYAQGEQDIPEPIARLLLCYLQHGLPPGPNMTATEIEERYKDMKTFKYP